MVNTQAQMLAAMRAVTSVPKDGHNSQQNFDFRGIDSVLNALGPALREQGVLVLPQVVQALRRDSGSKTSRGAIITETLVEVAYRFQAAHGDQVGEVVPVLVWGEALDSGDKGMAKAMSVAYRIALIQAFALPTGEPDPDEAVYERGERDSAPAAGPPAGRSSAASRSASAAASAPPTAPAGSVEDAARADARGALWEVWVSVPSREPNVPALARAYKEWSGGELKDATAGDFARFGMFLIEQDNPTADPASDAPPAGEPNGN